MMWVECLPVSQDSRLAKVGKGAAQFKVAIVDVWTISLGEFVTWLAVVISFCWDRL
jgi:hypothetical protein